MITALAIFEFGLQLLVAGRALLRPHRDPSSRVAWLLVIITFPVFGIVLYLLLGETSIGRERVARRRAIIEGLPKIEEIPGSDAPELLPQFADHRAQIFSVGRSISEMPPVGGNQAELIADSNAAIDRMVADIDAASDHVHVSFYIWLPDNNGRKMAAALMRAAQRGVVCRAMVDDLGSRTLIKSDLWKEMAGAGVKLARALKIGNLVLHTLTGRIDIRNHRKIVIIDNEITFCGSQNCADPEFLVKAKYAPWVDVMIRVTGPVVRQNQYVFASGWTYNCDEDIRDILARPLPAASPGFTAEVIATGPTARPSATTEMFESVIWSARNQLTITTPYFVPVGELLSAICAAGNRGIETKIIFPARNDAFAVGATSRGYYRQLLEAGVRIFEYVPGLLHTKSITVDGVVTLIGSANMDRRSFDLNYENNLLLLDEEITSEMITRQQEYLSDSVEITLEEVQSWGVGKQLYHNAMAIVGPVL